MAADGEGHVGGQVRGPEQTVVLRRGGGVSRQELGGSGALGRRVGRVLVCDLLGWKTRTDEPGMKGWVRQHNGVGRQEGKMEIKKMQRDGKINTITIQ